MNEDRKLRIQQVLMLIVGVFALVVTIAMVATFVFVERTARMWWTALGPGLASVAMLLGLRKLPLLAQQLQRGADAPSTNDSP
ncbi:hypothetical protein KZC51_13895 [Microbacterium sp. SSW1-49]|uniref:Uncharacterized protein n=1 Tax=Microbacterium croceum TaxID=2851645 RepID=A0ABT0FGM9_9MICO|nr:hypothetical protein [Microbacterium croceum]MCK2037222.1 hypothetical protein [Microbacterium croceum]